MNVTFLNRLLSQSWIEQNWPAHHVVFAKQFILSVMAVYDDEHPAAMPAREVAVPSGPSQNAFRVLFGGQYTVRTNPASHLPSVDEEWRSYCHAVDWPDIYNTDPVEWWDRHGKNYHRLFQTSFIGACRALFSSSTETDTQQQNRISPRLMEELQMLKYMIKKSRLDFTASWECLEKDIELENDLQDRGFNAHEHAPPTDVDDIFDILGEDAGAHAEVGGGEFKDASKEAGEEIPFNKNGWDYNDYDDAQ
ncbi:hypothetical protein K439DRAFT_1619838 [Ramaria rubella]|nr:hypothetical protein K439DRAFT_1619838 [Ramaria rubella]